MERKAIGYQTVVLTALLYDVQRLLKQGVLRGTGGERENPQALSDLIPSFINSFPQIIDSSLMLSLFRSLDKAPQSIGGLGSRNVYDSHLRALAYLIDKADILSSSKGDSGRREHMAGNLTHNFARIARKAGLPGTRFHDLRHTFASLMLLGGVHPKIVSEMLGHSSVAFTLDTYSHVIGGLQQAAVRRLDEMLQPELKRDQDVGKMLATDPDVDTASDRIRTYDPRFTKPLLYP